MQGPELENQHQKETTKQNNLLIWKTVVNHVVFWIRNDPSIHSNPPVH